MRVNIRGEIDTGLTLTGQNPQPCYLSATGDDDLNYCSLDLNGGGLLGHGSGRRTEKSMEGEEEVITLVSDKQMQFRDLRAYVPGDKDSYTMYFVRTTLKAYPRTNEVGLSIVGNSKKDGSGAAFTLNVQRTSLTGRMKVTEDAEE